MVVNTASVRSPTLAGPGDRNRPVLMGARIDAVCDAVGVNQDSKSATPARRRRGERASRSAPKLLDGDRRQEILDEATQYFAERGFSGGTIELARRLGVTQPLLYRYFRNKEQLIQAAIDNAFPTSDYYPKWEALLTEAPGSVRERLILFYREYVEVVYGHGLLRLVLWAGLADVPFDIRTKYWDELEGVIFPAIVRAVYAEHGRQLRRAPTDEEIEMVNSLHGAMFHLSVRRWINKTITGDLTRYISLKVDLFLHGFIAEKLVS